MDRKIGRKTYKPGEKRKIRTKWYRTIALSDKSRHAKHRANLIFINKKKNVVVECWHSTVRVPFLPLWQSMLRALMKPCSALVQLMQVSLMFGRRVFLFLFFFLSKDWSLPVFIQLSTPYLFHFGM